MAPRGKGMKGEERMVCTGVYWRRTVRGGRGGGGGSRAGVHTGYTQGYKTGVHTGVHTRVHTGVFWISTGCGHDAVIKITERGNGIRKCVVSVPRFVCGADDALKLFFAVGTYALIKMPDLLLVKV